MTATDASLLSRVEAPGTRCVEPTVNDKAADKCCYSFQYLSKGRPLVIAGSARHAPLARNRASVS